MKYLNLINFQALSEEITGSKRKIKQSSTADKYTQILEELNEVLELYIKQSKRRLQPKEKNKNKARKNGFNR
jgi:hypothetical protein